MFHFGICTLIFCLSLLGFADSLYFTLVYYHRVRADYHLVPGSYRMRESECRSVLDSRYARVLGLPNSLLGLVYYTFTAIAGIDCSPILLPYAVGFSLIALLVSSYLLDALIRKLHQRCPLCFLAHAINATLFLLFATVLVTR